MLNQVIQQNILQKWYRTTMAISIQLSTISFSGISESLKLRGCCLFEKRWRKTFWKIILHVPEWSKYNVHITNCLLINSHRTVCLVIKTLKYDAESQRSNLAGATETFPKCFMFFLLFWYIRFYAYSSYHYSILS